MVATAADYLTTIETLPPGSRLSFVGVSWDEYEQLLLDLDERPALRVTYDHGRVEVMALTPEHERPSRRFSHLVQILTEELDLDFLDFGSSTLRLRAIAGGLEPDSCVYIGEFDAVAHSKRLDLTVSPPPDLAVEIDITHDSLGKFHLYAGLGVAELWRYDGENVEFYRLVGDHYVEIADSDLFPFLPAAVLPDFLTLGSQGVNAMRRAFRAWVRAQRRD